MVLKDYLIIVFNFGATAVALSHVGIGMGLFGGIDNGCGLCCISFNRLGRFCFVLLNVYVICLCLCFVNTSIIIIIIIIYF